MGRLASNKSLLCESTQRTDKVNLIETLSARYVEQIDLPTYPIFTYDRNA